MTVGTFVRPEGGTKVGVLIENVPDMETLQAALATEMAAAAMKHDGVQPDSIEIYVES
jgi:methylmalonyl-CoA mutase N-terminal domain/subunit